MLISRRWLMLPLPVLLLLPLLLVLSHEYAVARPSRRTANLAYVPAADSAFDSERHRLDVYAPRAPAAAPRPVVVFIHGGSWNSGHKNFYSFVGRRLAKLGVVAVVLNYRLAPQVQVPDMADDCARAVVWVTEHIAEHGGDPQRVFVMGHSAGGGLAALLAADTQLFRRRGLARNPVRGAILDDPAGLDMDGYLQKMEYPGDAQYLVPFGASPAGWRAVSALHRVGPDTPPCLVLVGGDTYPSIADSSGRFCEQLRRLGHAPRLLTLPGKGHVGIVLQLYWARNVVYRELLALVAAQP